MSIKYFPFQPNDAKAMNNPAIQLFGNRLFSDQTVSEFLVEFLLVAFSPKRIGDCESFDTVLPTLSQIKQWHNEKLKYAPKARLNLKLFSFIGASRLDSRHKTHRDHYKTLLDTLHQRIRTNGVDKDDAVRTIKNLFLGFQGAGSGRTWCAQSFLPVSRSLLAGETIWKEKKARRDNIDEWRDLFEVWSSYFDMNQHLFLARGGEVLYLQLCNALRQPKEQIVAWCRENNLGLSNNEQDPAWLHSELNTALSRLMSYCPASLDALAEFIDTELDPETPRKTDGPEDDPRFVSAGWCNSDSWQEGYLFAVELLRLIKTNLDAIDRIYLLENTCAMQALRTLAMQSARVSAEKEMVEWPGYFLVVSAPEDERPLIRRLSHQSLKAVEKMIFQALRSPNIQLPKDGNERSRILKQADKFYGGKLFVGLAKRIGLVVPKRGASARFVLNDQLLRLLVFTTVPPGGRLTFDTFKKLLEKRYGLVFDANGLCRASRWLSGREVYPPADTDRWLQEMLDAAGFLIHLSDSCALVHNPADPQEENK